MSPIVDLASFRDSGDDDVLFERIAADIESGGYSINPVALPLPLAQALYTHLQQMRPEQFEQAGIGRARDHMHNQFVRSDEVCWITGTSTAGRQWLDWTSRLQHFLNRRLFLGLFSFESHFAHYGPGDFYKRHFDAFKGEANRVLSLAVYLNPGWAPTDGGELVLYMDESDQQGIKVTPLMATLVVFLSEDFPHEVLSAGRDRYSIAGWYRVNGSVAGRLDPPQ